MIRLTPRKWSPDCGAFFIISADASPKMRPCWTWVMIRITTALVGIACWTSHIGLCLGPLSHVTPSGVLHQREWMVWFGLAWADNMSILWTSRRLRNMSDVRIRLGWCQMAIVYEPWVVGGLCIQAQPLDQGWYEKYCVQSQLSILNSNMDEVIFL